ncbi:MAG: tetratricopeptide repeat protein [Bacteroidia bacterium]
MKTKYLLHAFISSLFLILIASCGTEPLVEKPKTDSADTTITTLESINQKLRANPNDLEQYHKRAQYYVSEKKYAEALADMNRILAIDSNKTSWILTAADIYFAAGKAQRAEQLFKRAVEIEPNNTECLLRLAQLDHFFERYDSEMKLLDQTLKADIHNAQAYFMKGMVFKAIGDTSKAISSMQTAVEQDPDYYNAYIQLGIIYASQGNPIATQYYVNALKVNPSSEEALYNLAKFYQDINDFPAALENYTILTRVNPKNFDAHYNMGVIYIEKLKQIPDAAKAFNLAIETNSKDPRGFAGRGRCNELSGNKQEAINDYKMALTLDPQFTFAAKALSAMGK